MTVASAILLLVGVLGWQVGPSASPVHSAPLRAAHNDTSTPFNLVSMPALIRHRFNGGGLRRRLLHHRPRFSEFAVRYRSARLSITGTMLVPRGAGPFPVVLVAHGWHTPTDYRRHTGMVREDRILARHGYLVLQPDYRNYGGSTRESQRFVARPRGYPEDLINAVLALRRARLPFVARGPVALFGRSMGGGASLQALAARPHLFRSAVLYSPVSSSAADDYRRWVRHDRPLRRRVVRAYGTPATHPRFWRSASVRHYLGRVNVPVLLNHGAADTTCPPRWSRATVRALRHHGKRAWLLEYAGQRHAFHPQAFSLLMHRTLRFFAHH